MRKNNLGLLLAVGVAFTASGACSSSKSGSGNEGGNGGSGGDAAGSGGNAGSGGKAGSSAGNGGSSSAGSGGGSAGAAGSGSGGAGGDDFGFAGTTGSAGSGGSAGNQDAGAKDAALPPPPPPGYIGTLFDFENGMTKGWGDQHPAKATYTIDSTQHHGGANSLRIDITFDAATDTAATEWFPGFSAGVSHAMFGYPCWVDRQLSAWVRLSANFPLNIIPTVIQDAQQGWLDQNAFPPGKEMWFEAKFKYLNGLPVRENDGGFLSVGFYLVGFTQPGTYSMWVDDVSCSQYVAP